MNKIQRYNQKGHDFLGYRTDWNKYPNKVQEVIQDQERSSDSIQTPGWTSMVKIQQSKDLNKNQTKPLKPNPNHDQILNRLNSLPRLQPDHNFFSRIRVNSATSNKKSNVFVYGSIKKQQKHKQQTPKQNTVNKMLKRFHFDSNQANQSTKHVQGNKYDSVQRKRVSSVKSQPKLNLKDKIQQRISLGNKPQNNISAFDSGRCSLQNKENVTKKVSNFSTVKEKSTRYSSLDKQLKVRSNSMNQVLNNAYNSSTIKKPSNNQKAQNTRFKSISVFQHLHNLSAKIQAKKDAQRLIENSYEKATTLTFIPKINEVSNFLANSKFSRKENETFRSQNHCSTKCFNSYGSSKKIQKSQKASIYTIQQKVTNKQKEKMALKIQQRSLTKIFNFFSCGQSLICSKILDQKLQVMPLGLIQQLQPLLEKIYKDSQINFSTFLQYFQNMSNSSLKTSQIISQLEKFISKISNSQNQKKVV